MLFFLGLVCFIGGVYFLLVNLNIINKKNKEQNEKPIEALRIDNILIRLASVALCILGLYLIWPNEENRQSKSNTGQTTSILNSSNANSRVWNDELKDILNKQCIENGKHTAEQYPDLVTDYCKCATEKISQAMTPAEYTLWMDKPKEEQAQYIRPIVQSCVEIMTKLIELSKENIPQKVNPKSN